jgi:hypothetical protein
VIAGIEDLFLKSVAFLEMNDFEPQSLKSANSALVIVCRAALIDSRFSTLSPDFWLLTPAPP